MSLSFYEQEQYRQGFTTELPDDAALRALLRTSFGGTEKDYRVYIEILRALNVTEQSRLLDFGCSWGYGSWQLKNAGYDVIGVEVGRARAEFARKRLFLDVRRSIEDVDDRFDVVFSAHVMEHIPRVRSIVEELLSRVRPGGLLVSFTPNGSTARRSADFAGWNASWGAVHPVQLDDIFWTTSFAEASGLLAGSESYAEIQAGQIGTGWTRFGLAGSELLAVIRR